MSEVVAMSVDSMGDVGVVALPGAELISANVAIFKRDIAPLIEANTRLVLDLTRVTFLDSSALGALISCLRKLNAKGGDLKLCGLSSHVQEVFVMVRMDRVFDIYPTVDEAVRAYQR